MDLLHAKVNVSRSCFNTNRNSVQGSSINHTTPNSTEYVIQVVYPAMKLILVFAFVFSLGSLTLLAESIPRQEDTQGLESKQNDPSVNYRSDSLNRLKREIASGLLIDHRTQSPLIGSVIFFLVRRTHSLAWFSFFCRTPSAVALSFHIVPQLEFWASLGFLRL